MTRSVFRQPNGLYGIWSSISDTPMLYNATIEDVYEEYLEAERERLDRAKAYWTEHAHEEWDHVVWSLHNIMNNHTKEQADIWIDEMTSAEDGALPLTPFTTVDQFIAQCEEKRNDE